MREETITERLDEQKLAMLRRWGEGLTRDEREEVRAAGRAILLLSDEVERLHIDLWHARDHPDQSEDGADAAPEPEATTTEPAEARSLGSTLRERLATFRLSKTE